MASICKVILIGHLGKDPECRVLGSSGATVCNMTVATSRRYKDSQGQIQEETEWHRVSVFGKTAEIAQQYLRKGNPVYIEGHLRTRKYTDKEGIERYQTEIVCESLQLLGGKSDRPTPQQAAQPASRPAPRPAQRPAQQGSWADQAQAFIAQNRADDADVPF